MRRLLLIISGFALIFSTDSWPLVGILCIICGLTKEGK